MEAQNSTSGGTLSFPPRICSQPQVRGRFRSPRHKCISHIVVRNNMRGKNIVFFCLLNFPSRFFSGPVQLSSPLSGGRGGGGCPASPISSQPVFGSFGARPPPGSLSGPLLAAPPWSFVFFHLLSFIVGSLLQGKCFGANSAISKSNILRAETTKTNV